MEFELIKVPKGIKYLSDWKDFELFDHPCIINKQITGCGFTEFCLTNDKPIILCSPRKILLKNKEDQHFGDVYYVRNNYSESLNIDGDPKSYLVDNIIPKEQVEILKTGIKTAYLNFKLTNKVPKFLVTYDSFRYVKETLINLEVFQNFYVIVDEFQSIFTDSRFKADTELEFVNNLQGIDKLNYVSATPMLKKYLETIDEFKDLHYVKLDWKAEDPLRIDYPNIDPISYKGSLVSIASSIIDDYTSGKFEKDSYINSDGEVEEVESKEVVIFVNSVKNICDIIKKCKLTFDNTNVLCADTESNKEKIRKAFKLKKTDLPKDFLMQIPKLGEEHKMFTLCTKTVYLGADFYSTNARTVVLSDGNIECLAVDISLDLSQILGRQRLAENPWKNCVELYFKTGMGVKDITEEEFEKLIEKKIKSTDDMINLYNKADEDEKQGFINKLEDSIILNRYKNDYISINKHAGSNKIPKKNSLVMISERRAFDIQRKEYFDRVSVMSQIEKLGGECCINTEILETFLVKFNSLTRFTDKMKLLCEYLKSIDEIHQTKTLHLVPKEFKNYCTVLGVSTVGTLSYQRSKLMEAYKKAKMKIDPTYYEIGDQLDSIINIGDKISKADLKTTLQNVYNDLKLKKTAKATDIEEYFDIKPCKIPNKETGKRDMGFEIIKKK